MKTNYSHLIAVFFMGCLLISAVETVKGCEVTSIITPQAMVRDADIIVRAKSVKFIDNEGVNFKIIEVIKGVNVPTTLIIKGSLEKQDDFNKGNIPYEHVRSSGHGPCFAYEYKEGGEFLLLLKKQKDELTPYWSPLAPTNEQLGSDYAWLKWVKEQLKSTTL